VELNSALPITAKLPQEHSLRYKGLPIVIQWPKGSTREGTDKDGKKWRRKMEADYGFVDDTSAKGDKEPLDVYIGPERDSDRVFVIEQLKEDGKFDEFKAMLGFGSLEDARKTYLAHYPKGWEDDRVGEIYEAPFSDLVGAVDEHKDEGAEGAETEGKEKSASESPAFRIYLKALAAMASRK